MKASELHDLKEGDIIRGVSGEAYVVILPWPNITAVRALTVTNPQEWTKINRETGQPE